MSEIEEKVTKDEKALAPEEKASITIDLKDLYRFGPEDISIEILEERYSNLAYMQVTHRDVYIDFLSMPGIKKDGKMNVRGIRVFMSHVAAQRLTESLCKLLEEVHHRGDMEIYLPEKGRTPTTKMSRKSKDGMV